MKISAARGKTTSENPVTRCEQSQVQKVVLATAGKADQIVGKVDQITSFFQN